MSVGEQRTNAGEQRKNVIAASEQLADVLALIDKAAPFKSTVLLLGESGTGKELLAHRLHESSPRAQAPFVAINCGAIPEALIESELFGYVKGAFTDARRDKRGLFQTADGGTLFLDEVGDLPLTVQVKLLRFLQDETLVRVGDTQTQRLDVRVVAASSRDLPAMVRDGRFREDLYYRLNVLQVQLPPLRERKRDIDSLVNHFIAKHRQKLGVNVQNINPAARRLLHSYDWPGNVRELENAIEQALVLADSDEILPENLPERVRQARPASSTSHSVIDLLEPNDLSIKHATVAIEQHLIRKALEKTGGNRTRAAEILEISHRALLYKLKEYGIR